MPSSRLLPHNLPSHFLSIPLLTGNSRSFILAFGSPVSTTPCALSLSLHFPSPSCLHISFFSPSFTLTPRHPLPSFPLILKISLNLLSRPGGFTLSPSSNPLPLTPSSSLTLLSFLLTTLPPLFFQQPPPSHALFLSHPSLSSPHDTFSLSLSHSLTFATPPLSQSPSLLCFPRQAPPNLPLTLTLQGTRLFAAPATGNPSAGASPSPWPPPLSDNHFPAAANNRHF